MDGLTMVAIAAFMSVLNSAWNLILINRLQHKVAELEAEIEMR